MKAKILLLCAIFIMSASANFLTAGMDLVSGGNTPSGQQNMIKEMAVPYLFDMLTSSKFNEFPFEGGKLTNIEVKVIPPKSFDQVKVDVFSDTLFFQVNGLGAKIGADFEVLIKKRPSTGHLDIDITDLGVDIKLKNEPTKGRGNRQVGSEIKLDLEHTHADIRVSTEGNVEEIKSYFFNLAKEEASKRFIPESAHSYIPSFSSAQDYLPDWTSSFGWKIETQKPIQTMQNTMQRRTQDIVDEYYSKYPGYVKYQGGSEVQIPGSYKIGQPKVLANYQNVVASRSAQPESIKDKLIRNRDQCFFDDDDDDDENKIVLKNKLLSSTNHIQNHSKMNKLDYKLSDAQFSKFFVQSNSNKPILNKEMVKQLLVKDNQVPSKLEKYFGDKVQYDCIPSAKEPKLRVGQGDSIIGTFTIECKLTTLSDKQTVYEQDLDLEFVIHPDNKSDGKPSDSFGEFADMDMQMTPDGNSKITARINDQPSPIFMFPGFEDLFGDLFRAP